MSGRVAIAALQPLVNLARLSGRAGDPQGAFRAFIEIDRAVHDGGTATVHGKAIAFDGFSASSADRAEVSPWLRVLLREDGTRALAATGDWNRAAAHAAQYDDAVHQLRDARQSRILANAVADRAAAALDLIRSADLSGSWDAAVAACLSSYVDQPSEALLSTTSETLRTATPDTALAHVRLGLTALELAFPLGSRSTGEFCRHLVELAIRSQDAFSAREILRNSSCLAQATKAERTALTAAIDGAALDHGQIPARLLYALTEATEIAGVVLAEAR